MLPYHLGFHGLSDKFSAVLMHKFTMQVQFP